MGKIIIDNVKDCNLNHIFQCGQCFRWEVAKDGKGYVGTAMGKIAHVTYDAKKYQLTIEEHGSPSNDSDVWRSYFDLDTDYSEIKNRLISEDDTIREAIEYGYGIRILRQDLWEVIVSFIISQNNHIPRIKGCINNLAKEFGNPIGELDGISYYDIPTPDVLYRLTPEDMGNVRLGYRAKYLQKTAEQVMEVGLPKTYEQVLALNGVGPKVANCISLFGLGDRQSFPIDVWVRRVMNYVYGLSEDDLKGMAEFASNKFGELGGYAQQYLFYFMREHGQKVLTNKSEMVK